MISTVLALALQLSTPALDADYRDLQLRRADDAAGHERLRSRSISSAPTSQLNAAWRDAIAGARDIDRGARPHARIPAPTYEAMLRAAQRAWLTFRDAHCTWQAMARRAAAAWSRWSIRLPRRG